MDALNASALQSSALRIAGSYFVVATLWIVGSDTLLGLFVPADLLAQGSMAKGLGFVAVTTWLLYRLSLGQLVERVEAEQTLLASSPLALVEVDGRGQVTRWSRRAERLFGIGQAEALSRPLLELGLLGPGEVDEAARALQPVLDASRGSEAIALEVQSPSGPRFTQWYVSRRSGRLPAILALVDDRTEEHRLTEALKAREIELSETAARLQAYGRDVSAAREDVRLQLARDLHDDLGQVLTAIRMTVSRTLVQHPETAEPLEAAMRLSEEAIQRVRAITAQLRPPLLDRLGLGPAIEALGKDSDVAVVVDVDADAAGIAPERAIHVYRVAQEALTNVERHAEASVAELTLVHDGASWHFTVDDDGRGLGDGGREGFGLISMTERAGVLGGRLEVVPSELGGVRVSLEFPVDAP